ncbi:MAG: hypothetical protein ABJF50_13455 [Paracoccaceae bacterium]
MTFGPFSKTPAALLLGAALFGLAACDQQSASPTESDGAVAPDDDVLSEVVPESGENGSIPGSASGPATVTPEPSSSPATAAKPRPSPAPARSPAIPPPTPVEPEVTGPPDPHAGHDMGSMSERNMDDMRGGHE